MPNVDVICFKDDVGDGWSAHRFPGSLTEVFCTHAGCRPEDVHIRFHNTLDRSNYAIGGRMVEKDGDAEKRIVEINVAWYAGRSPEVQDAVAAGLTDAASQRTGLPPQNIEVNFSLLEPSTHYEGGKRAPAPKI